MSGPSDDARPESVAEMAAGWFARLQDEAATGEDWLAFETWLGASPAHAAAYERVEGIWVDLDAARDELTSPPPVSLADRHAARTGLSRRGWLAAGVALAAGLAVAVVGVTNWPSTPTETYSTTLGETRQVVLPDGSKVWLNAASRIDVRLGRRVRHVQMAEGEAAFDVTHDPRRPFLIDVGEREVRVVGTEFNVRQRSDQFALTVRRGVVEVRPAGAPQAAPTRVAAGHRLTHARGAAQSVLSQTAPDDAFAWTRGQLAYADATLDEVAADLSRSLGRPVRVADRATGALRFSGVLALDDPATVAGRLEAFVPVRAEVRPDSIVLHRR